MIKIPNIQVENHSSVVEKVKKETVAEYRRIDSDAQRNTKRLKNIRRAKTINERRAVSASK